MQGSKKLESLFHLPTQEISEAAQRASRPSSESGSLYSSWRWMKNIFFFNKNFRFLTSSSCFAVVEDASVEVLSSCVVDTTVDDTSVTVASTVFSLFSISALGGKAFEGVLETSAVEAVSVISTSWAGNDSGNEKKVENLKTLCIKKTNLLKLQVPTKQSKSQQTSFYKFSE